MESQILFCNLVVVFFFFCPLDFHIQIVGIFHVSKQESTVSVLVKDCKIVTFYGGNTVYLINPLPLDIHLIANIFTIMNNAS